MSFLDRLQSRWKLRSVTQVVLVLIVFACTGFTVMFLKKPIIGLIADSADHATLYSVLYYLLILPIYNIVLLGYGFIFRQFTFFWNFEKRMWFRFIGFFGYENTK